jgi:hypothetical protein
MKRSLADEPGKRLCPLALHFLLIVSFEVAVARLVKADQNRHDFTQAQAPVSVALLKSKSYQLLLPLLLKGSAKVIDTAEQFF